ncbi:MAG TPA: DUF2461 domain-containing protein [Arsenicitalea sp.]|jgi:uncharacterized protein (TIGR02453 family)|nr:DUF2461 domain-containing protein [Arsenicitalea sp.]
MDTAFAFPPQTFEFLAGIAANNEKPWFEANRALYEAGYVAPGRAMVEALGPRLREISPNVQFDAKPHGSLSRINRDVRFSKNKAPYKTHLDLWFWHGERRGWSMPGFWFRLTPETVYMGTGMHGFEKETLEAFRQSVVHPRSAKALLAAVAEIKSAGPYDIGEKTRKLLPRGFAADGLAAEYLLYEGLHAGIELPAEAARQGDFVEQCVTHFRATWPVSKWLLQEVSGG